MKLVRIISLYLICLGFFLASHNTVYANGEFEADYDVTYEVSPSGRTTVTQEVTLTNVYTNLYARQYGVTIDSLSVSNIIATDGLGSIIPDVVQQDGKTDILLTFNEQVVGLGNSLEFTLRYQNDDITKQNGSIWEIQIPGVTQDPNLHDYTVSLVVPEAFGPPAYMSPPAAFENTWTKDQLMQGGVNIAFGTEQHFDLDLAYHLENPESNPVYTEIALPPDTAYQRVTIVSIDPAPASIRRDEDGNWLARYDLGAQERIDVSVIAEASITLHPRATFTSTIDKDKYTSPTNYWPVTDEQLMQLSQKYDTPEKIYDYVVGSLTYNYSQVEDGNTPVRKGAVNALATPDESVCMEFTDVFVAMARAAGIPARQLVGYAHTTNSRLRPLSLVADVLHAWPEYYDFSRQAWVPVDPTWGHTTGGVDYFSKLDFNHIVFAINGVRDDFPYPAGSYKKQGKVTKDIEVLFSPVDAPVHEEANIPSVEFDIHDSWFPGLSLNGEVEIHNIGSTSLEFVQTTIEGADFGFFHTERIENIPPFGTATIPVNLKGLPIMHVGSTRISVKINDAEFTHHISITPLYLLAFPLVALIFVGGIITIVLKGRRRTSYETPT